MTAIARSPISPVAPVAVVDGWQVSTRRSTAALRLADVTPSAKVMVKADANGAWTAGHRTAFGEVRSYDDGVLEVGSDPGGWLYLGPIGSAESLMERLSHETAGANELVTVIDLTHGRAMMRLTGADSVRLMSKICAVDLSDRVTPNRRAFRSSVAKLVTDVIRNDLHGTVSYLLHCERSSGQHLFDCVLDAGAEFGIDVDGWR